MTAKALADVLGGEGGGAQLVYEGTHYAASPFWLFLCFAAVPVALAVLSVFLMPTWPYAPPAAAVRAAGKVCVRGRGGRGGWAHGGGTVLVLVHICLPVGELMRRRMCVRLAAPLSSLRHRAPWAAVSAVSRQRPSAPNCALPPFCTYPVA
jgi:hypothetical protein